MAVLSLPALRFQFVRMWRTQPWALVALLSCLLALGLATVTLVLQQQRLDGARAELQRLSAVPAPTVPIDSQSASAGIPELPPFASAPLVAVLNDTASESGLVLDEVRYALDDNAGMPYLRYRITLSVNASYPLVRRLAERLQGTVPHLTIDAVHCARKNVQLADLTCELELSGLFRKGIPRG
jgi:hypothetical protein